MALDSSDLEKIEKLKELVAKYGHGFDEKVKKVREENRITVNSAIAWCLEKLEKDEADGIPLEWFHNVVGEELKYAEEKKGKEK
jgi:hypothetical protein